MKKKYAITFIIVLSLFMVSMLHIVSDSQAVPPIPEAYQAWPPFLAASVPPAVMLVMGRNHKLYYEAYNDASDLDGDGSLDVTYKPDKIDYYGYFDNYKYYQWSAANNRFEPVNITLDKTAPSGNYWSGDFLNYLTMSRMDALRKVLYGGYRSTDTGSDTVLERVFLPQDAHSWGKEYESVTRDGYDITQYSPLDKPQGASRHLFVSTSLSDGGPPLLRVLENSVFRIWEWVAIERPVAGSQGNDGTGRRTITDNDVGTSTEVDVTDGGAGGVATDNATSGINTVIDDFSSASLDAVWTYVDHDGDSGSSQSLSGGELLIDAGGADVWTGSDEFGAVFLDDVEGNFDVQVKITSQEQRNVWGKCGIMVRNDMTAPGSSTGYVAMAATPDRGHSFQFDNNNNGYLDSHVTNTGVSLPVWLRIQKVGTTFTAYRSTDGVNWTVHATRTMGSAAAIQDVGLFVTSHSAGNLSECRFDDFSMVNTLGSDPSLAFDDNNATAWTVTTEPTSADPIMIQFAHYQQRRILKYTITTSDGDENRDPLTWYLLATNDATVAADTTTDVDDWEIIDKVDDGDLSSTRGDTKSFECVNPPDEGTKYYYYRLLVIDTKGSAVAGVSIAEIEMMETTDPIPASATLTDREVRVQVCVPTLLESNCKQYPDGNHKPIGLLQRHGESDSMYFGLMSGSYTKNTSGGVLRKNISSITDEIDSDDGTITGVNGIINTINTFRVVDFDYGSYSYDSNCGWITTRPINEGDCRMWGNPIGEMMYETLRYFGGEGSATSAYTYSDADDNAAGTNLALPKPSWDDPYDASTGLLDYCSKPFMLVLSDIYPTFDSDQLPGSAFNTSWGAATVGGASTALNVDTLADTIFAQEETAGNRFIGEKGSNDDGACTEKYVDTFSDIRGLCPEEPTKEGSYYSASVAWYGRTEDLYSSALGSQSVRTYAVGLASPLPKIDILLQGRTITMVPFAKSVGGSSISADSDDFQPTNTIVDFFVEELRPTYGKFRINYEDVEQGADHDMDAIVTYEYQLVDADGNPVSDVANAEALDITLSSDYAAGGIIQHMGYIISGTTQDGTYLEVRDEDTAEGSDPDYFLDTPPGVWAGDTTSAWDDDDYLPLLTTRRFVVDTSGGATQLEEGLLTNPLWYAAKWGGFEDRNDNDMPDQDEEWDKDSDGVPDTYYYVVNPLKLEQQLNKSFADILEKSASGTAASVLATNSEGEGNLVQAYFEPKRTTLSSELNWIGYMQSLWVDPCGNLREDSDHDLELDNQNSTSGSAAAGVDKIIQFFTDVNGDTKIYRFTSHYLYNPDNGTSCGCILDQLNPVQSCATTTEELAIDEILPLFEVGELLSQMPADNRNIFTFLDGNGEDDDGDGLYDESGEAETFKPVGQILDPSDDPFDGTGELILFKSTTGFIERIEPFLGVNNASCNDCSDYLDPADDQDRARVLIDYIRGKDQGDISGYSADGLRPRTLDNGNVWKLGDIVNSTPLSVGKPPDNYHIIYSDESYQDYFDTVKNRETVVYVGANDGMLHAFTSYKYDSANGKYVDPLPASGLSIGDEIWAYIPQTLLPHLKWLADPSYAHTYYVDLKPKVFDAKIDIDGSGAVWRTLLICGLNFGGKHIWVEDDFGAGNVTRHFYPAYFCLDITNPRAPRLLWERSYIGLGMTVSAPAIVKVGNSWFALIGSGPNDSAGSSDYDGKSDQKGHVFVVDLKTGTPYPDPLGTDDWRFETTETKTSLNSPVSVDWGLTYNVDGIYFGTSYEDASGDWRGMVYKITTWYSGVPSASPDNWSLTQVFDGSTAGPIVAPLSLSIDSKLNVWLFFGTGRYYSASDKINADQQYFFGIKDPFFNEALHSASYYQDESTSLTLDITDLFDSNDIYVTESKLVFEDCPSPCSPYGSSGTWDELLTDVAAKNGWYFSLQTTAGSPSERIISKASILGGIVFAAGYTPNDDVCGYGGDSSFFGVYFESGTGYPKAVLPGGSSTANLTNIDGETNTETIVGTRIELGSGAPPPAAGFHVGQQEGAKAFLQMSTGEVIELDVETAINIKSGLTSWRERSD